MKYVIALLGALTLTLALAACDPDEGDWVGPNPSTDPPPRLAIVGDSLIDCCDEMWVEGSLVQSHPTAMWTIGGTRLPEAATWLEGLTPRPNLVVIAQGTNNARPSDGGWNLTDLEALGTTLAAVDGVPCIVLVNLGFSGVANADYKTGATAANADYASLASSRIRVANWRGWSSYAPQWFDTDGIHHTAEGRAKYLEIITSAVNAQLATGTCS